MSVDLEALCRSLQEVVWHFGTNRLEGKCFEELSHVECRCLRIVTRHEDCPMGVIAEGLGLSPSGTTRVVDRLEEKGFLIRITSMEDGRICCARATEKGIAVIGALQQRVVEDLGKILERMPEPMAEVLQVSMKSFALAINPDMRKESPF
jgi:DNA-binding MarR family transcriptional regulator